MRDLAREVRRDALAHCAWHDAVMPAQAARMRAMFGGGEAKTYEDVKRHFGDVAAEVWQDAIEARLRFFAAVQ